jgi:hypothetical protein
VESFFVFGWLLPLLPLTIASKIAEEIGIKNPSSNVTYGLLVLLLFYNWWLALSVWRCAAQSKTVYKILARVFAFFHFAPLFLVIRGMVDGTF